MPTRTSFDAWARAFPVLARFMLGEKVVELRLTSGDSYLMPCPFCDRWISIAKPKLHVVFSRNKLTLTPDIACCGRVFAVVKGEVILKSGNPDPERTYKRRGRKPALDIDNLEENL